MLLPAVRGRSLLESCERFDLARTKQSPPDTRCGSSAHEDPRSPLFGGTVLGFTQAISSGGRVTRTAPRHRATDGGQVGCDALPLADTRDQRVMRRGGPHSPRTCPSSALRTVSGPLEGAPS